MGKIEVKDLIKAGVHFGHLTRKWNPNMAPFIYMERNGIHIINLYKTISKLEEASEALKKIAISGRKILFVATKKQAKDIVSEAAKKVNMPYITERWPGGMLTNFITIRKAVKKMSSIDRMKQDGTFNTLSKKEKLQIGRLREKLEKNLGSDDVVTRAAGPTEASTSSRAVEISRTKVVFQRFSPSSIVRMKIESRFSSCIIRFSY